MTDFELYLQPGNCPGGPADYYARFYYQPKAGAPRLSRPVYVGAQRAPVKQLLHDALLEFSREASRANIGAVSLMKLCHRKEHQMRPRLEREASVILADRMMPRTAAHHSNPVYRAPSNGFGAVRRDLPSLSVANNVAFMPVTYSEESTHPITEIIQVNHSQPPMYVALRGLEQIVDFRRG
ncbi:MAG: hypothetical protein ABIV43_02145 [Candidatus Saccharimonadales bacterium]